MVKIQLFDRIIESLIGLVNKCMSEHLNANINYSLNLKANGVFQEYIKMQMFWDDMQNQIFLDTKYKCT